MKKLHLLFVSSVLLVGSAIAIGQQRPEPPKTVPDSINLIWKSVEKDFTSLAEAMPEDKWSFKPTQGEFKDVRTFAEQVKHVACANEAWAKQMGGEKPPARCDLGGPNPAKTKAEILAYLHDDVEIHEKDWDKRVLKEFEDETVGLVGFAGGRGHCRPELYRVPYFLPNLARQTFLSNMRSWQTHGERFTAECDVAVLDGCVLFVRRSVLDHVQGWMKAEPYGYWLYSEWLCCETRRQGLTIRLVGIDFEHLGGKSSGSIATKPSYEEAHRFLFENNRDVLPFRVE